METRTGISREGDAVKLKPVEIEPGIYSLIGYWFPHRDQLLEAHALYEKHRDRKVCIVDKRGLAILIKLGVVDAL